MDKLRKTVLLKRSHQMDAAMEILGKCSRHVARELQAMGPFKCEVVGVRAIVTAESWEPITGDDQTNVVKAEWIAYEPTNVRAVSTPEAPERGLCLVTDEVAWEPWEDVTGLVG